MSVFINLEFGMYPDNSVSIQVKLSPVLMENGISWDILVIFTDIVFAIVYSNKLEELVYNGLT